MIYNDVNLYKLYSKNNRYFDYHEYPDNAIKLYHSVNHYTDKYTVLYRGLSHPLSYNISSNIYHCHSFISVTDNYRVSWFFAEKNIKNIVIIHLPIGWPLISISQYSIIPDECEYVIRPETFFSVYMYRDQYHLFPIARTISFIHIKNNYQLSIYYTVSVEIMTTTQEDTRNMEKAKIINLDQFDINKLTIRPSSMDGNYRRSKIYYAGQNRFYISVSGNGIKIGSNIKSSKGKYYIDLVLPEHVQNVLNSIDTKMIEHLNIHSAEWYSEDVSSTHIEYEYMPSVRTSWQIGKDIGIKTCTPYNLVNFYDQDGFNIPSSILTRNMKCSFLLYVDNLSRDEKNGFIRLGLNIIQVRAFIPNILELTPEIKECQIDGDGDGDGDDFDDYDF